MKNKKTFLLTGIVVMISFILCGCRQNQSNISKNGTDSVVVKAPLVIEIKNSSFSGIVKDREGKPLAGVSVLTGNQTVQTNEEGFFSLNQVKTVNGRTIVTFDKVGYFSAIHSGEWQEEEYTEVILHPYGNSDISLQTTFDLAQKQTLSVGKMKIELPAGSLVDSLGNIYKDTVSANLLYLDPATGYFAATMPGSDLAAACTNGQEAILVSYGMVKVELKDTDGNKLQLQKEKPATATYPVPASMEKTAPDTIPLWFFNEETGLWEEEGFASRQGELYIGQLAHFTWWNVDYPYQRQEIRGRVTDCNGKPIVNTVISTEQIRFYTNTNGEYRVFVPAGISSFLTIGSAGYVDSIPARVGGTVLSKDIKLSCPFQLIGKIENTCGESIECGLFCEYKLREKKYYTSLSYWKTGKQFNISFPSGISSVILHILLPDGKRIEKEFACVGKDIHANNIEICFKNRNKELVEVIDDDIHTVDVEIVSEPVSVLYDFVKQMPQYPGGEAEMRIFIAKNMRYPISALEDGIQGRVVVRFVVLKTGEISDIKVVRGIHPLCDQEAVRVIKMMPKWIPGMQDGEPVDVIYNVPVVFKLIE